MKTFALFRKKPDFTDFCIPEAKALLKIFDQNDYTKIFPDATSSNEHYCEQNRESIFPNFPLVRMNVDDITAKSIIQRSVLINSFIMFTTKLMILMNKNITLNITHLLLNQRLLVMSPSKFRLKTLHLTVS